MEFERYQSQTDRTAIYPGCGRQNMTAVTYLTFGLCGEAGEVAEKVKKILRDKGGVITDADREQLQKELGDVLWYWSRLHTELGMAPSVTADQNLDKLLDRQRRGVLGGSGDNR